jgi:Cof subfamily protein (haloacid dehalogenase superfamily)
MYRLLATDIDDTLLAPDGSLPEANHRALQRLHEAGVTVVFCSGRSDVSIRGIAATILEPADDEYLISFNGARVVTADTRRHVSRRYVRPGAIEAIVAYAHEHGLQLQGYAGDEFLVERADETTERYALATKTSYRVVADMHAALPEGSPKMLLIGEHDALVPHRDALRELGDSLPEADRFVPMFSKPHYLEMVAAGVSKGDALRTLARRLEIPIGQTLAVGDGDNDVDMIRAAGTGVAVASAYASAREAADVVLETTAADGAMEEIARRFFSL